MSFQKPSAFSGGAFFKPLDHMNDLALLIEPKRIDRDQPYSDFYDKPGIRDEVIADITVFANSGALEKGEPSSFIGSAKVVHGMLTDMLGKMIGEATVATVAKVKTKNGSGYVFRDATAENTAHVEAFYDAREAAIAEGMEDMPSFDEDDD